MWRTIRSCRSGLSSHLVYRPALRGVSLRSQPSHTFNLCLRNLTQLAKVASFRD